MLEQFIKLMGVVAGLAQVTFTDVTWEDCDKFVCVKYTVENSDHYCVVEFRDASETKHCIDFTYTYFDSLTADVKDVQTNDFNEITKCIEAFVNYIKVIGA